MSYQEPPHSTNQSQSVPVPPPTEPPPDPYATQPGAPPAYYQPQPMAIVQPPQPPNATLILILGIAGLVLFTPLSPVAWYLGNKSRKKIAAAPPGTYRDAGFVTAGWIMGIIGTIFLILTVVLIIVFFSIAIAAGASQSAAIV